MRPGLAPPRAPTGDDRGGRLGRHAGPGRRPRPAGAPGPGGPPGPAVRPPPAGRGVGQQELRPPRPPRRAAGPVGPAPSHARGCTRVPGPVRRRRRPPDRRRRPVPGPGVLLLARRPARPRAGRSRVRRGVLGPPRAPGGPVPGRDRASGADPGRHGGAGHAPAAGRTQPVGVRGRRRCRLRPPRQPGVACPAGLRTGDRGPRSPAPAGPPPHRDDRPGQAGHGAGRRTGPGGVPGRPPAPGRTVRAGCGPAPSASSA